MRPFICALVLCVGTPPLFWSSTSHAQAADVARKLLEEAKRLKDAGKLPEACPLLDRAYEMDAKDGLLFARADCRDQERKIAAAVSLYEAYLRSYSRMTGATKNSHAGRATIAEARLNELRPLVPMIKFVWAEPPPPETKIIVDDIEFRASTLDVRLPLDPGTHEIVVLLPGEPERRRTITLAEGGSTIVDLTPLPPKSAESPKSKQGKSKSQNGTTPKPVAPSKVDPWKVGGFIGIGLGAAGIIAGSITGSMAIAEKRVVDANCTPEHRCNPTGLAAADRFQTVGNASTAAFIAGGVIAAVGTTLVVMAYRPAASSRANAQLRMTVSPSYLGFEGAF
ncbi:MAG: tetratricopeptide repeat protein [Polyangiaceae bacterium]|nr:tetratricopeptide repeat protein [Polyangiaceae bacterium]